MPESFPDLAVGRAQGQPVASFAVRIARYGVRQGAANAGPASGVTYGVVEGDGADAVVTAIAGHPFATPSLTADRRPLAEVQLLAPFIPSKVVAIGKNYAAHAREMGGEAPARPVVFLKPSTAVIGPNDPIQLPRDSARVDYEGELALVIGKLCRDVPPARVRDVVLGYTCANDVTARDQQQADGQWTRGKGHDTFCPIGPWVETELDPADLGLRTVLDGVVVQDVPHRPAAARRRRARQLRLVVHDAAAG